MIIGAGGACRSIAVELGNKNVDSIELRNRSESNAKIISDSFGVLSQRATGKQNEPYYERNTGITAAL